VGAALIAAGAEQPLATDLTPMALAADDAAGELYVAVSTARGMGILTLAE
jgi:hypothetical protein